MEVYDRERIVKLYDSYSDEMKEDVDYCDAFDVVCIDDTTYDELSKKVRILRRRVL